MKAQLKFLKDFYSPLHKKTLKANSSIEIDVDADGVAIHSFWFSQLKDDKHETEANKYFELILPNNSTSSKPKNK